MPDQPTQWRNAALNEIYLRCRCTTLNGYPDSLKNLFNTFVDKQIVAMERAVQVANISRQLKTLLIDLQTLSADELTAGAQGRLLSLAPAWALQNLPAGKPPTVLEFRKLCNTLPQEATVFLDAPKADPVRVKEELAKLKPALAKTDNREWARRIIARKADGEFIYPCTLRMAQGALA